MFLWNAAKKWVSVCKEFHKFVTWDQCHHLTFDIPVQLRPEMVVMENPLGPQARKRELLRKKGVLPLPSVVTSCPMTAQA